MEQKKYDVFISYSRKDYVDEHNNVIPGNEVSKIKEALTKAGITFWFDEEGMCFGDKFTEKITDNIEASQVFLFLSTKNSCESPWTSKEIACADEFGKFILPVRIDKTPYNKRIMFRIADLSFIDYENDPEKGRQEVVRSIKVHLKDINPKRQKLEEKRKLQEQILKIGTEIESLMSQKTERKKVVLQKEQELKLAQEDLEASESKMLKMQKELQELITQIKEKKEEEKEGRNFTVRNCPNQEKRYVEVRSKGHAFTVNDVKFKMICVIGGKFWMGSADKDTEAYDEEKPQHLVTLDDYEIGETVVTQALWKAVMGVNPSFFIGDDNPVENVSWDDCQEFIKKLNLITNQKFRLPTEAEWEFAARGGVKSKGYRYAGSDAIDELAWYENNSGMKTHPVKCNKPNELGLYDMSGNVWEWCKDRYDNKYYSNSPQVNPSGPSSGSYHVVRGGGWFSNARYCRVTYRLYGPSYRNSGVGFRLVI